ncbi:unnamed protein product, partial [Didymodactylos carnosus]
FSVSYRMIYAVSNAGVNPNVTNVRGNTPLHEALIRGYLDVGGDVIQALFRIGVDPRIKNKEQKTADWYLEDNTQLVSLYEAYGQGIWAAIEENNFKLAEKLIKGFIKVDCKHVSSSNTLLEKAQELKNLQLINLLSEYQVTNEFVHSILANDFDRMLLIHKYQFQFIKVNAYDSLLTRTWYTTSNRTIPRSLLEVALQTQSPIPVTPLLELKADVNVLGSDGYPLFFHAFAKSMTTIRTNILEHARINTKSFKGETILFYLIHLACKDKYSIQNDSYFRDIICQHPLLLADRNESGRTIIDEIELTPAPWYDKLKVFRRTIDDCLFDLMKEKLVIEKLLLAGFGCHLLLVRSSATNSETLLQRAEYLGLKNVVECLNTLPKYGLSAMITDLRQAVRMDDLTRIQDLFSVKDNIHYSKDWNGRTIAHLAILYKRPTILQYIGDNRSVTFSLKDNLHRTPLHYAYIMNDKVSINILQRAGTKKFRDCKYLYPEDYLAKDVCSDEFHSSGFVNGDELERRYGIGDYVKVAYYETIKTAIETNNVEQLKMMNSELEQFGFTINDFNPMSYIKDWIRGQRYVPPLFIGLEARSLASLYCLLEMGTVPTGNMYVLDNDYGAGVSSGVSSSSHQSRCISLRGRAEELECFDIVGMFNDLEDDSELKAVLKRQLPPSSRASTNSDYDVDEQKKNPSTTLTLQYLNTYKLPKRKRTPGQGQISQRQTQTAQNEHQKSQACIIL